MSKIISLQESVIKYSFSSVYSLTADSTFFDFTHDLVQVALRSVGHHKGINHREKILLLDPLGDHGVCVHILQRQALDGLLVAFSGSCNEFIPLGNSFPVALQLLFALADREKNLSLSEVRKM